MNKPRIIVTGATGKTGSVVVSELLKAGYPVRAMVHRDDDRSAQEARAALAGRLSSTAAKVIGLQEAAGLPEEEAIAVVALRTRQYAAYQRKWMRRIPGLVSVRGDRPATETAREILDLAGRREPLSARRAD